MRDAPHSLRVLDEELDQLRGMVSELGGRVETAIGDAVGALVQRDEDRARRVVVGDDKVDALAADVEQHAIRLIALRAPLADDLREVLAALKIAALIARMGDCAKNIARRSLYLRGCRKVEQLRIVPSMEEAVSGMVAASLDAFVRRDAAAAIRVCESDREVDEYYACLFRTLVDHMIEDPQSITAATHLLMVAQKLERIGDHATGVAEIVHFAVTGEPMPPQQADRVPADKVV